MSELTPDQLRAIPLIINAGSVSTGCINAGIGRTTYYEWLKQDSFKKELRRIQTEVYEECCETLKESTIIALETLNELMCSGSEVARIKASQHVLSCFMKLKEMDMEPGRGSPIINVMCNEIPKEHDQ